MIRGYGDLACNGNPIIHTPNLDRLSEESIRLTNFHVSPYCAPTRASLMTGRHCRHVGVTGVNALQNLMTSDVPTMAEVFLGKTAIGRAYSVNGTWATITRDVPKKEDSMKS